MRWPGIETLYGPTLRQSPVFAVDSKLGVKTGPKSEGKTTEAVDKPGDVRWEELHKRVIEHVRFPFPSILARTDIPSPEYPSDRSLLFPYFDDPPDRAARLATTDYRANTVHARERQDGVRADRPTCRYCGIQAEAIHQRGS